MKGWVVLSSANGKPRPHCPGPVTRSLFNQWWLWAGWATLWVLGTVSQTVTASLGNAQPSRLDFFFCAHPQPPPLENNAGEKCLLGNLIYMENILFFNLPAWVGFSVCFQQRLFHHFSHPTFLLRNWMLLPKMGIFSFPFTPSPFTTSPRPLKTS